MPGYGGYGAPGPGQPGYVPPLRTNLEIGYLYGAAIAYGVGAGVWIDSEAYYGKKVDPGLALIAPVLFGAAVPVGVFFADRRPMREGLPSAIASGLVIGAGEGLVIGGFEAARATSTVGTAGTDGFTFRSLTRAEIVGSTIGGVGGIAYGVLLRPTPQRTMFITSAAGWGSIIGFEFGAGASGTTATIGSTEGTTAPGLTLGGVIGYNLVLAGVAGASAFWTPSWNQLGWMWAGFGIGEAVSTLVYPFYAATGGDAKHGLIFQGVAGSVGAVVGAFIGHRDARPMTAEEEWGKHPSFARIRGGGLMPVPGGAGATINGELW